MAAGLVDRSGQLSESETVRTPRSLSSEEVWSELALLVKKVLARPGGEDAIVCGVGCGGPMSSPASGLVGTIDPAEIMVSPLNIPAWRDFPLWTRLNELTGLPTAIDNDGKALALGEGWVGAATGCGDFIAMVVSTGVGGGIVLDGRLLNGRLGNAGHIGHVVVEPSGRICECGGSGCLEAEASGTAIAKATGRPAAEASPAVVARTGTLVGRAIASVANLLDLRLAVVGGSVALGFGAPFFVAAREEVQRRARLEFARDTKVLPAALGSAGPLVGAGAVGWRSRLDPFSEAP